MKPNREQEPASLPFVEARGDEAPGSVLRCGLCGAEFTHGGQVCSSCPLGAACDLVRCPSCGYQFPRRSRIVDWARRIAGRLREMAS